MRLFLGAYFNLWTLFFIKILLMRLKVHPFERKIIFKKFFENRPIYCLADFLFEKLKIGRAALHKNRKYFLGFLGGFRYFGDFWGFLGGIFLLRKIIFLCKKLL